MTVIERDDSLVVSIDVFSGSGGIPFLLMSQLNKTHCQHIEGVYHVLP
jgi:hypothetical protein